LQLSFLRRWNPCKLKEIPAGKEILVLSFTSIRKRFSILPVCLEAIFQQSLLPDVIVLYVSELDKDAIPANVLDYCQRGLRIAYVKDLRSYTKFYYAAQEYPHAAIVTCDDDLIHPTHWLKELWQSYLQSPEYIHCHRAHTMKFLGSAFELYQKWHYESYGISGPNLDLFPTGNGGILYPPRIWDDALLDEKSFLALAPTADDVWLRLWSLYRKIPVRKVRANYRKFVEIQESQTVALHHTNWSGNTYDAQISAVWDHIHESTKKS
jgi:hypothetical protein